MGIAPWSRTILNTTNNRLESINGKLKPVISRNSSLEEFKVIFCHPDCIKNLTRTITFKKTKVQPFAQGSPESEHTKLLTSYASALVLKQLELAKIMKEIEEEHGRYVIQTSEGERTVSLEKCVWLPLFSLLHIFAL